MGTDVKEQYLSLKYFFLGQKNPSLKRQKTKNYLH